MKRCILILLTAVLFLSAGCIQITTKTETGTKTDYPDIFKGMTLDETSLIFCCAEDQTSARTRIMYSHDDKKQEFLKALSTVKAEPVNNWSFEDVTWPLYGFYLMDAERYERGYAWSNGILYTYDGKKYKFDFDFTDVQAYPYIDGYTSRYLSGFPCAQQFMLDGDRWNTEFMSPGLEPADTYDVDYEVIDVSDGKATVRLTNHMKEDYFFGEYFSLQVLTGGAWYDVPLLKDLYFNDLGYSLAPEQSYEMTYNISLYGNLPGGHYRIHNDFGSRVSDLAAEFDLP